MLAVETIQLSKTYNRKIVALDEVSLKVKKGTIFGLLGPNGAGKTTLIKILLGIVYPTTGSATLLERPLNDVPTKEKIGYLAEDHRYPEFLKGRDVLEYFARLAGVPVNKRRANIDRLLEMVNMQKWQSTRLKKYSKGMLQRLGLAQAMMNDPELLFLDEPTDGVDPIGRKEIRDILVKLKEEGKTIFVNSHLLSEVEMICDEVAILDKGKLIRTGTVEELTSQTQTYRVETSSLDDEVVRGISENQIHAQVKNGYIEAVVSGQAEINRLIDYLRDNNVDIKSLVPHKHSLEESFIKILKQDIKQGDADDN